MSVNTVRFYTATDNSRPSSSSRCDLFSLRFQHLLLLQIVLYLQLVDELLLLVHLQIALPGQRSPWSASGPGPGPISVFPLKTICVSSSTSFHPGRHQ
eukprot:2713274-Heterocapsa_arctica.AAC.1